MVLEKMGIEIRKIGSLGSLYREVDMVLEKAKNIQLKAIAHGLQNMFRPDKYLNICFIQTASEICGVVIPRERMLIYQALHCISWNEMQADFRVEVQALVLDDFRAVFLAVENG